MKSAVPMVVSALLMAGVITAEAQDGNGFAAPVEPLVVAPDEPPSTYGTAGLSVYSVTSLNFTPRNSSTTFTTVTGLDRLLTSVGALQASPNLPNGSQLERVELRACDTSATDEVSLAVGGCPTAGQGCVVAAALTTGAAASPGCGNFTVTLATPLVVNNQATPILLSVATGTTAATTFTALKLYYRLRVSPAPSTATFPNDVPPTHAFFRFVEALASAGITGGCGAGSFCPDSPVTRGQMAAFLSVALGLHFPN